MKKFGILLSLFMLLSAFTCEDEPLDEAIDPTANLGCEQAALNTADAALAFVNATDGDYTDLCLAYKMAIQDQISSCGDQDGSLQQAYDALGDCGEVLDDCNAAENYTQTAASAYQSATEENYTQLCNAYKDALEAQIDACGDDDGGLQATIDDLDDCTNDQNPQEQELSLFAGSAPIDFEDISVVVEDGLVKVTGVDTSPGSTYSIYFEVEESVTGEDVIQNFELTLTSVFYPSEMGPPFEFSNTIETNETGILIGGFNGLVTNADGGDLDITNGTINITY